LLLPTAGPSTDGEDEIDSSQAQEYSLCNAADLPESELIQDTSAIRCLVVIGVFFCDAG